MTLTKADLAEDLVATCLLERKDAKFLVDEVFEVIRQALESGESVKVSGLGNFDLKTKKERPGRNPKTGETALVSARRVVSFHAGQKLKDRVAKFEGTLESE